MAEVYHIMQTGEFCGQGRFLKIETQLYADNSISKLFGLDWDDNHLQFSTTITYDDVYTNGQISNMFFDIPVDKSEPLLMHLQAIDHIEKKIGEKTIQQKSPISGQGQVVYIDRDEKKMSTKLRFPRYYLPDGLNGIDNVIVETILNDENTVRFLDTDGNDIHALDRIPSESTLLATHNLAFDYIIGQLKTQYNNFFTDINQEYDLDYVKKRLSWVDYWDDKYADMINNAKKLMKIIKEAGGEDIEEIILMGSLARNDKIPDDYDFLILVNDPDNLRIILNPDKYSTEERRSTIGLRRYNVQDVTDGLCKELGITAKLDKLSRDTYKMDEEKRRWRDEPHQLPFGMDYTTMDLNSFYANTLGNRQKMTNLMKNKVTPAYWLDALTDGLVLRGDELIPIAPKYKKEIATMQDILKQAEKERWWNHRNDFRLLHNNRRHQDEEEYY